MTTAIVGLDLRPGIDGICGTGRLARHLRVTRQVQPRRRIGVAVRVTGLRRNPGRPNEFTDARIGLVAEADPVDQPSGDGVVAQQRRLVRQFVDCGRFDVPGFGDLLPHLAVQAVQQPAVRLAVGLGVTVLREKVCGRLVFAAGDELRLDACLVERVTQEQRVRREADESDRAGRLHPDLAESRGQVVGQRAGIGFGPRQRGLDVAECGDRVAKLLNRTGRGGRDLHAGDQAGDPRVLGSPVNRRDGLPEHQRPAAAADDRHRVEPARLGRGGQQIQLQHAAVGHTVVAGGIYSADQRPQVVGAGNAR